MGFIQKDRRDYALYWCRVIVQQHTSAPPPSRIQYKVHVSAVSSVIVLPTHLFNVRVPAVSYKRTCLAFITDRQNHHHTGVGGGGGGGRGGVGGGRGGGGAITTIRGRVQHKSKYSLASRLRLFYDCGHSTTHTGVVCRFIRCCDPRCTIDSQSVSAGRLVIVKLSLAGVEINRQPVLGISDTH